MQEWYERKPLFNKEVVPLVIPLDQDSDCEDSETAEESEDDF